ncbi:type IV pilus biogenesis protein PilM [Pseudomonas oryzihabitans]|uniref:type IV pilus biogenesis protein PilM n=1 Tax=Pseudomonas oryzihabitans TaxID=47885 RepID=UPI002893E91C|nr:type IV pilus biogenesis protein PilM [Pseudomonas oryzihabitans]MDT3723239.1 type IV pilus biogenesis protein PilM [Pseudomonas oryzihabitans]
MPILWIILAVMTATVGLLADAERTSSNRTASVDLDALAYNLLTYRNALAEYAHANPTMTGAPVDSVLALPTWYRKLPNVSGYVSAGQSFTYYPTPPSGLVSKMVDLTQSQAIGTVVASKLQSPISGNMGVVVPATIPNGSALAYQ